MLKKYTFVNKYAVPKCVHLNMFTVINKYQKLHIHIKTKGLREISTLKSIHKSFIHKKMKHRYIHINISINIV